VLAYNAMRHFFALRPLRGRRARYFIVVQQTWGRSFRH